MSCGRWRVQEIGTADCWEGDCAKRRLLAARGATNRGTPARPIATTSTLRCGATASASVLPERCRERAAYTLPLYDFTPCTNVQGRGPGAQPLRKKVFIGLLHILLRCGLCVDGKLLD